MNVIYILLGFIAFCEFIQTIRIIVVWRKQVRMEEYYKENYEKFMKECKQMKTKTLKEKNDNEKR